VPFTKILPIQAQGLELFNALGHCMQQAVSTNVKDVLIVLNLVIQMAPSNMWADAMHHTGLFKWLLNFVVADKVSIHRCIDGWASIDMMWELHR
jgi:importin-11